MIGILRARDTEDIGVIWVTSVGEASEVMQVCVIEISWVIGVRVPVVT